MVEHSILRTIKILLGIAEDHYSFDSELIIHINSALMMLNQLGIGPDEGFMIHDELTTWKDLLNDRLNFEMVKGYIYLRVRLIFDPPQMSYLVKALDDQIREYEWRIMVQQDRETINAVSE